MIPNQWYAVLDSKQLKKKNKPIGVTRLGEKLVIWRDSTNRIHCIYDRCCHRGAELHNGKIVDDHIQCPFHGLEYDGSGKCVLIPANSKLSPIPSRFKIKNYHTQEKHGFIWIWWGEFRETYPNIPWMEKVDQTFHYFTIYDHWNAHYSRIIENQLDVVHLPYVHHNTIGRGGKTVVEGPYSEIEKNHLKVWYMNRREDGNPPKKIDSVLKPTFPPMLHFKFPHIWQNRFSAQSCLMVAFTPIDEQNTMVYARFCQNFVKIPGLKHLVSWFGKLSSIIILHQDRRAVETQMPKASSLHGDEKLFQGDLPIILYRRRRAELKNN